MHAAEMVAAEVAEAAAWPSYAAGRIYYEQHAAEEAKKVERLAQAELLRDMFRDQLELFPGEV
jgi:hypothetical protein